MVGLIRDEAVHTQTYHEPGNGVTTREQLPWRLTTITTTQKSSREQKGKRRKMNQNKKTKTKKRRANQRETNQMQRMSEQLEKRRGKQKSKVQ